MKATLLCVIAFAILPACSDDDATPGADADAGGDGAGDTGGGDAGETGDTGGGDGGVHPVDGPILERTPTGTASCAVERAVTRIVDADYQIDSLLAVGSSVVVTRAYPVLSIARTGLDGVAGEGVVLDAQEYAAGQSTSAFDGASVAVVWFRQDDLGGGVMRFAAVAADDLEVVVPARDVAIGHAQYLTQPVIVARPGGWALLYAEMLGGGLALRFVRLGADGVVEGAPVTVAQDGPENIGFAHNFIATDDGYAATWASGTYDAAEVLFARLDAQGAAVSGPHRISRPKGGGYSSGAGYRTGGNGLRAHAGKYYAAFSETYSLGSYDEQNTSVIGRVAVIDGDGNGELHALQAPVEDMTTVMPSLHIVGENIGVLWSYGTIIYICGGCITDYDLHFALLDPATMAPVAPEVVQLSDTNGFTNPRGAVVDGKLFTTTALDFHALSYPATGVFACEPQ